MNIKKSIFSIVAFYLIINAQVVYTKDSQDDNNNSQITSSSHDNDTLKNLQQYDEEMWKIIEETFQSVIDQTQKIEFCLQQIEQIIGANKITFNEETLSKKQVLKEIKGIKAIIQNIFEYYSKELTNKDEALTVGTCFNTAFISYLLPVFQNDIKQINLKTFKSHVAEKSEEYMTLLQDPMNLANMIETNESDLVTLMNSGDYVGLSTFNKIYRYLDTAHLPLYGKSTLATAYDAAYWSSAALLAYTLGLYVLTTDETVIPGTTWTAKDLPLKSFIGSVADTKTHEIMQDAESKTEFREKSFGLYNRLHQPVLSLNDQFVAGGISALAYLCKKPLFEAYEATKKSCSHAINYYLKGDITPPKNSKEVTKTYFNEMIGGEHLEKLGRELTDYLKNPTRYERAGISPSTGYLLVGPAQTGKSFFAKALKTMVDESFDGTNEKIKFAIITADDLKFFGGFTDIFYWARKNAPIILFMDEIDMFGTRRDRDAKNTQELLTAMNGMETDPSKKVIVIAATNKPEELDFALKQKGRLGTVITFDFPTYECRKEYLEKQLAKKNIVLSNDIIDTIAQETDAQTYNMIDDIIRQSLQLATFQTRPVEEADFEMTLDREIRKIKPNTSMSAAEKELVAIYQAGQSVARHVLKTDQHIVKITINTVDKPMKSKEGFGVINEQKGEMHENHELLPQNRIKPTRLGFVFTMSKTNNHELISDSDQDKELMALLAGQAALELLKGATFNGFGKEDRAKVLEVLEKKISQGTPIDGAIRKQAITTKEMLYQQVKTVLENHTDFITLIADELCKNNTINTKQWIALSSQYPA